jgi:BioD-like phosphotransacetylase family protein
MIKLLNAEVLTKHPREQALVENMTVGAMTADAALSRFRKYSNKAVITGGDRTDIQLAALETSTTCLILTGNLRPSPLIVKQAEEFGVAILLVRKNTMETIEASACLRQGPPGETKTQTVPGLLDKSWIMTACINHRAQTAWSDQQIHAVLRLGTGWKA